MFFSSAPTNEAFNALPAGTLDTLLDPANIDQLQDILQYHVVEGTVLSTSLTNGPVTTLNGDEVTISGVGTGVIKVNDATVTTADIVASNGVIHVIDAVLIPPQTRPPLATRPPLGAVTRPPIDPPTTNSPTTNTPTIKPTEAVVITPPPTVKVTTLAPITASPTINPVTLAPVTPAPVPLPDTPPPTPPPQAITTPTTPFPTEIAPPLDTSSPTNLVSRPLESPPPIGGGGGGGYTTGDSKDDGWMTAGMPDSTSSEDYEWVSSDHKDCVEDHTPIFGYSKSSKKSSHWGWGNSSSHEMSLQQTTEGSKDDGWNRNGHTTQGASWMSYDQIMMHFKSKSSKKKCKSHKSSKSKSSKSKVWGKSSKMSGKSNKSSKGGGWNYNNALERVDFIGNGGSSSRLQWGSTTFVMFTCLVMGIVVALGSMC